MQLILWLALLFVSPRGAVPSESAVVLFGCCRTGWKVGSRIHLLNCNIGPAHPRSEVGERQWNEPLGWRGGASAEVPRSHSVRHNVRDSVRHMELFRSEPGASFLLGGNTKLSPPNSCHWSCHSAVNELEVRVESDL